MKIIWFLKNKIWNSRYKRKGVLEEEIVDQEDWKNRFTIK